MSSRNKVKFKEDEHRPLERCISLVASGQRNGRQTQINAIQTNNNNHNHKHKSW